VAAKADEPGILRAAFRPTDEVCVVRAVARQRDALLAEQASWIQRMQKTLVQMNIQLTEVLTDVMGLTGQAWPSSPPSAQASATRRHWPGIDTVASRPASRRSPRR